MDPVSIATREGRQRPFLFVVLCFIEFRLRLVERDLLAEVFRRQHECAQLTARLHRHHQAEIRLYAILPALRFLRILGHILRDRSFFCIRRFLDDVRMTDHVAEIRQREVARGNGILLVLRANVDNVLFAETALWHPDVRTEICRRLHRIRQVLVDILDDFLRRFPLEWAFHRIKVEHVDLLVEIQPRIRHRLRVRPALDVLPLEVEPEVLPIVVHRRRFRARLLRDLLRPDVGMTRENRRAHACRLRGFRWCLFEAAREVLIHLERLARHALREFHFDAVERPRRALDAVEHRELFLQSFDDGF